MRRGGRAKGVPNYKSLPVLEIAAKKKCNPLEVLMDFVNGDWQALGYDNSVYIKESKDGESTVLGYTITPEMRCKAAIECCKYMYPQRKALEIDSSVTINNPFSTLSTEEKIAKAREVVALLEEKKK